MLQRRRRLAVGSSCQRARRRAHRPRVRKRAGDCADPRSLRRRAKTSARACRSESSSAKSVSAPSDHTVPARCYGRLHLHTRPAPRERQHPLRRQAAQVELPLRPKARRQVFLALAPAPRIRSRSVLSAEPSFRTPGCPLRVSTPLPTLRRGRAASAPSPLRLAGLCASVPLRGP